MKVLVVGGGGREHAIVTKVNESKRVDKIYAAPGNAGNAQLAECVDISVMDKEALLAFAKEKEIDFVIVGPDDPLVAGVADSFSNAGFKTFGPAKNAAIIEGSKAFSKDLMKKYNIPSAAYETFDNPDDAISYLETAKLPIVLKADGLALGKGVHICNTHEEAKEDVDLRREVSALVNKMNWTILYMNSAELTLEDIFLKITMGEGVSEHIKKLKESKSEQNETENGGNN